MSLLATPPILKQHNSKLACLPFEKRPEITNQTYPAKVLFLVYSYNGMKEHGIKWVWEWEELIWKKKVCYVHPNMKGQLVKAQNKHKRLLPSPPLINPSVDETEMALQRRVFPTFFLAKQGICHSAEKMLMLMEIPLRAFDSWLFLLNMNKRKKRTSLAQHYIQMGGKEEWFVKPSLETWWPLKATWAPWWPCLSSSAIELDWCLGELLHGQSSLLTAASPVPRRSSLPAIRASEWSCSSCCPVLHFLPAPAPASNHPNQYQHHWSWVQINKSN